MGGGFLPLSDCDTGLQLDCRSSGHRVVDVRRLQAAALLGQGTVLERKHAEIHGARARRMAGSALPKPDEHNQVAGEGGRETLHEKQTRQRGICLGGRSKILHSKVQGTWLAGS